MVEKNAKSTTIEISIETYNRLHAIGQKIEEIVHKRHHISFDETLKVMLTVKPLDETLDSILLEGVIPE